MDISDMGGSYVEEETDQPMSSEAYKAEMMQKKKIINR